MIKICVDPGHGGAQPGAVNGRFKEKVATLAISLKLRDKLKENGFKVIMTRDTDIDVSLKSRCKISNDAGANAFISIHLNSCHSDEPHGAETWKWHKTRPFSKALADAVQADLIVATGAKNRGVKESDEYYVLRHTKASALVVECGFISNNEECRKLFTYTYQDRIADGICRGIIKAFNNA